MKHRDSLSRVRILVVDDHPIVRQGYRQLISAQCGWEVCGEAESEAEALRLVRETTPDMAIVDITLSGGNGIDLIKQLAVQKPEIRQLAASAHDESLFAERALQAGALGYINKNCAIDHLITAIRTVLDGDVYLSERMRVRIVNRLSRRVDVVGANPVDQLSNREVEAFELIGQGLCTREIAERMHVAPKTVDRYRENIKHKLELKNGTELIRHATQWVLQSR
jgi:DNA-binding NarL/FixJ family response regulator